MSRSFTSGFPTPNLRGSPPITAAPFTISAWGHTNNVGTALSLTNSGSTTNFFRLFLNGSGHVTLGAAAGGAEATASRATVIPTTDWFHMAAVASSSSSRFAFLNGVKGTENTTNLTPSGIDRLAVGCLDTTSKSSFWTSNKWLAEIAIYNAALTDGEIAELAARQSPFLIRPDALVSYYKLLGNDADVDWWGQNNLSAHDGTPNYEQFHTRLIYPDGIFTTMPFAGGGGGAASRLTRSKLLRPVALAG